jgi:hypothetical protein
MKKTYKTLPRLTLAAIVALSVMLSVMVASTSALATTCGSAINIPSAPVAAQALVCGATNDLSATTVPATCGAASNSYKGGQEALYTFTPTTTGSYDVSIAGQTWTAIFVYNGCPDAGGICVSSISSSASSKTLTVALTAGSTYYIWFDTWPTPNSPCPGTFSLAAAAPPPPPYTCGNAINIPSAPVANQALVCSGTNDLNSSTVTPVCGGASTLYMGGLEAIYSFTPGTSGNYDVSIAGQTYTGIFVYDGCPTTGTCVGATSSSSSSKQVQVALTAGTTYYIWFDTWPSPPSPCPGTFSLNLAAPPAGNDVCGGAIAIACGGSESGTTVGTTNDIAPTCVTTDGTGGGVWYSYVGTGDDVTASLCGSGYDTKIRVYTGTCGALSCVTGNDDFCGLQSQVTFNSVSGTNYFILVHGFSSAEGAFTLNVTCLTPSGNDVCSAADPIACGTSVSSTTSGATTDSAPFCGTSNTAPGVWYLLPNPGAGLTIQATTAGSSYDTKLTVFTNNCASLGTSCVDGDDDGGPGLTSLVTWGSNGTDDYLILVHGFGSANGNFTLGVTCQVPPGNDVPCNALPAGTPDPLGGFSDGTGWLGTATPGGTSVAFDLSLASAGADVNGTPEPSPGAGTVGPGPSCDATDGWCSFETGVQNSLWYAFVAPATGNILVTVDVTSGSSDAQIAIWANPFFDCSDYGQFVEVWANDDGGAGLSPIVTDPCGAIGLIPGDLYFIQLDGFAGASVAGNLTITEVPVGGPPANDVPCGAVALGSNGSAPFDNTCAGVDAGEPSPGAGTVGPAPSCDATDGWCSFATGLSKTLWYTVEVNQSGQLNINTSTSTGSSDLQLALWSATDCNDYATYTEVYANDDGGPGLAPAVNGFSCLTPGTTYLVQLDPFGTGSSTGTITVSSPANDPLSCDAGLCQSRYLGYPPAEADTNFLVGSASGGFPPYQMTWTALGPDMNILYTNQLTAESIGAAVQPNIVGANSYQLTVVDAFGCSCTSTVDVNVIDLIAPCLSSSSGSSSASSGSGSAPKFKIQVCKVCPPPSVSSQSGSSKSGSSGSGSGSGCQDKEKCVKYEAPKVSSSSSSSKSGSGSGPKLTKIEKLLAEGSYLGPCDNACRNSNASFPAPPPCLTLVVDLTADNFGSETSWSVTDLFTGDVILSFPNGSVASGSVTSTDTCVDPNHCYEFLINDSFGDGICCTFGTGAYQVSFNGDTAVSNVGNNPFSGSSAIEQVGPNCPNDQKAGDSELVEAGSAASRVGVVAFPNPFSESTTISFTLDTDSDVRLDVYSTNGAMVTSLYNGAASAGTTNVNFQANDLPSGIYIYRMVVGDAVYHGKVTLAK